MVDYNWSLVSVLKYGCMVKSIIATYFPKEDGSFDLKLEEVQNSKFFVEGPDLIDASHSAGVAIRCQESGCVNAKYCGSFSAVEKRIRCIGYVITSVKAVTMIPLLWTTKLQKL